MLALTASAYSPRVIRRFMRDQLLQIMLGVFVAAVVFALVTLRLVTQESVPRITVTVAVALAFVAIGLLVAFFHHLSAEIRVESIIFQVHGETVGAIAREASARARRAASRRRRRPRPPPSRRDRPGRVAWIDDAALEALALASGGTLVVTRRPGLFVARGDVVLRAARAAARSTRPSGTDAAVGAPRDSTAPWIRTWASGCASSPTSRCARSRPASTIPPRRTRRSCARPTCCGASRATRRSTAESCTRGGSSSCDPRATFEELLGLAVDQVRRAAEAQADVATMLTIVTALDGVLRAARRPEDMAAVRRQARMVVAAARRSVPEPADVARVEAAVARLV